MSPSPEDHPYTGDRTPAEAWEMLQKEPRATLVDCRTTVEWAYVGVPVLDRIGKEVVFAEWLSYPVMDVNKDFVETVTHAVPERDAPILFLCRSGVRSQAAAAAMTAAGYTACYNILEGFEGDKDADGCRGDVGGWRKHGLPWRHR